MKCNENEMWRKKANFHLINYSYIIHLSCIFCAFTLECKYILRLGLEREQKPAKQTFICVSVNLKQIIAWVYHNFFVSLLLLLALYWNSLLSLYNWMLLRLLLFYTQFVCSVFVSGSFHSNGCHWCKSPCKQIILHHKWNESDQW